MARRTGLGRGLDALIPGGENNSPGMGVEWVAVERIAPNPRQPRRDFDPATLAELAESIREHGILQPLIVSTGDQPGMYNLIAGERRLLAARQLGLDKVPVILREASEQEHLELALIENIQRANLNPLEAAEAYRQLSDEFNLSHEEIALQVGKKRSTVTNTLRLLNLPAVVCQALIDGRISEGHARNLLALSTPQAQEAALQTILTKDLNVRQTEELVRMLNGQKKPRPERPGPGPEILALEERLRTSLGTRVTLNQRRKGGTLVIHYYSDEELDVLVGRITGND